MAELGPLQLESQTTVCNDPSLGQFASIGPLAPLFVASLESGVGLHPKIGIRPLERFRRRTRPIEHDFAEPFQPPAVAEIEKFVVVTIIRRRGQPYSSSLLPRMPFPLPDRASRTLWPVSHVCRLCLNLITSSASPSFDAADSPPWASLCPRRGDLFSLAAIFGGREGIRHSGPSPIRSSRSACFERLAHVGVVLRLEELQQRLLQPPLAAAAGHIDRLAASSDRGPCSTCTWRRPSGRE